MNNESIFIADFAGKCIREKVMMEKPKYFDSGANDYMYPDERTKVSKENYEYNKHIASRRTFPYPVSKEQDGKELREGKDFRIVLPVAGVNLDASKTIDSPNYIAIPIEPDNIPEGFDGKDMEDFKILAEYDIKEKIQKTIHHVLTKTPKENREKFLINFCNSMVGSAILHYRNKHEKKMNIKTFNQ